jgi:hypothetical protein
LNFFHILNKTSKKVKHQIFKGAEGVNNKTSRLFAVY